MDGIKPERPERSEERPARGSLCLLLGRLALETACGRRETKETKANGIREVTDDGRKTSQTGNDL